MPADIRRLFDDEVDKRLSSNEWSAMTATAVFSELHSERREKAMNIISYIVPLLATAATFFVVFTSFLFHGMYMHGSDLVTGHMDFTGYYTSEVDSMMDYIYYGRE